MIYAVIPTGDRKEMYLSIYQWCIDKGITPITIATSAVALSYAKHLTIAGEGMNISRWWNLGLKHAYSQPDCEFVLVLNDDIIIPDGWLPAMIAAIEAGYTGASNDRAEGRNTISGWAFILDPKQKVLCDENLVWWYGDDDVQRQCEQLGGFGIIDSPPVENILANSTYSRMQAQTDLDAAYYRKKWAL